MFSNLAPWAVGISRPLADTIQLAARHGFGGLDLPLGDAALAADPRGWRQRLAEAGLRWGGFGLPVEFRREDARFEEGLAELRRLAPVAQAAGCDRCYTWIMPGHDELDHRANLEQHARRLRPVAQILADQGIRFGVEFVGTRTLRQRFEHPFIHTIDGGLELADAIGADSGLLLDSFHWYTSGGTANDITGKLRGRVVYVHVNDARPDRAREDQIDDQRALPLDTGVIDLAAFMGCLRGVGYDGPVTAEPFMPELARQDAEQVAARVSESIRRTLVLAG